MRTSATPKNNYINFWPPERIRKLLNAPPSLQEFPGPFPLDAGDCVFYNII